MKIVNDEGEVLHEGAGNAVLVFEEEGGVYLLYKRVPDNAQVPFHIQLAAAVGVYLKDKRNVQAILDILPKKKQQQHRHN